MMDALISNLRTLLTLPARPGWILLIAGAGMLLLVETNVIPRSDIAAEWMAGFWLSTILGGTILLVSAGSSLWQRIEAVRKESEAKKEKIAREKEAAMAAALLYGRDASMLASILAREEKNFIGNDVFQTLSRKGIIRRISPGSEVYEVVDTVWSNRKQLLEDLNKRSDR